MTVRPAAPATGPGPAMMPMTRSVRRRPEALDPQLAAQDVAVLVGERLGDDRRRLVDAGQPGPGDDLAARGGATRRRARCRRPSPRRAAVGLGRASWARPRKVRRSIVGAAISTPGVSRMAWTVAVGETALEERGDPEVGAARRRRGRSDRRPPRCPRSSPATADRTPTPRATPRIVRRDRSGRAARVRQASRSRPTPA